MCSVSVPYGFTCAHGKGVKARRSAAVKRPCHSGCASRKLVAEAKQGVYSFTRLVLEETKHVPIIINIRENPFSVKSSRKGNKKVTRKAARRRLLPFSVASLSTASDRSLRVFYLRSP